MSSSRRRFLQFIGVGLAAGAAPSAPCSIAGLASLEARREQRSDGTVLLDRNENAYGPSPAVRSRLQQALGAAHRYPVSQTDLIQRIARQHSVAPEQVVVGCGSTELIRALADSFLGPGKSVVTALPTYEAMSVCAKACGAQAVAVPLDHEYSHDLDAMLTRIDTSTALVYICNPNNPTGSITPRLSIEKFLKRLPPQVNVVVDEAYHHFAPRSSMYASFLDDPLPDQRIIVLRTFSKVYGLAGLRVGYAVASPKVAAQLRTRLTTFGVSEVGLQAALAALEDEQGLQQAVKRNADDRQEFINQATARMLKPIDSKTNFAMMDTQYPAFATIEHFRANQVLIGRAFPAMDTFIRVSFGQPQDMRTFWKVWDMLPYARGMKM